MPRKRRSLMMFIIDYCGRGRRGEKRKGGEITTLSPKIGKRGKEGRPVSISL